jgi:hypothetical protein
MKRGYMFTLDVIIAIVILVVTTAILLDQLPEQRDDYYIDNMGHDIVNVLSHTRTTDLCTNLGEPATCDCPNYDDLEPIACNENIRNTNASILELYSEALYTETIPNPGPTYNASVHEIFVDHHIIDENRFGFSLIATGAGYDEPVELYNTEGS